jgi:C4-dicarboxylate transporter, DctM subunit
VVYGIGQTSIADFAREVLPFLCILIGVLVLITYVPAAVTWLPDAIMGVD